MEEDIGAGNEKLDGSTRKLVMRQVEEMRGAVLNESFSINTDPSSMQTLAILNRDKLSSAWLQCLPGPEGLSNAAFSKALALALVMPSLVCRSRVGTPIGKKTVDAYRNHVESEHLIFYFYNV